MRRFLLPNNNVITEKALRDFYVRVRELIVDRDNNNAVSITEKTLEALDRFFTRLGKPQYEYDPFYEEDPVINDELNDLLSLIINDIGLGYEEVVNLRDSAIAVHNFAAVHVGELQRRADEIAGLVTDLTLLSGQQGEEVIVFSDNFVDESKLDSSFPVPHLPAQIVPGQGSLTLNRISTVSLSGEDIEVRVTPVSDISRNPTPDNTNRFYEGHFYSFLGEAEPEGGTFHLEEKLNTDTLEGFDQSAFEVPNLEGLSFQEKKKAIADFVVPGGSEAKFLEQLKAGLFNDRFGRGGAKGKKSFGRLVRRTRLRLHRRDRALRRQYLYYAKNPEEAQRAGFSLNTTEIPKTAENFIVVDKGASEQELQASRYKMLDGNPGSYWQCELVRNTDVIQNFVDAQLKESENAEVSAAELRDLAQSIDVDKEDFEVEIVFRFNSPRTLNWITINPMTFDDGAFVEVTDLSTSQDLESEFVPIESFVSGQFSSVLTDEANEELSEGTANFLLAPSRYSYRGNGVWPFAARVVTQVKIRLKQRTPVPNPYEKIVLEAERTHTIRTRRRG